MEGKPLSDRTTAWTGRIEVPAVERWWPHTHGRPALHPLSVELAGLGEMSFSPVGFRSLEADTTGGGFAAPGERPAHLLPGCGAGLRSTFWRWVRAPVNSAPPWSRRGMPG